MSTQNLIMEGLRRVDERALFLRRIHSFDAVPVLAGKAEDLTAAEERLILLSKKAISAYARCCAAAVWESSTGCDCCIIW